MIHHINPSLTLVDELPLHHEHHIVKKAPDIRGRLVNCENNSFVFLICEFFQQINNTVGRKAVEPRSRLVEEDRARVTHHFIAYRCAFLLSSRNPFHEITSDECILAAFQTQTLDDFSNFSFLVLCRASCLQVGSELEALLNSHRLQKNIVLHDISSEFRKFLLREWLTVC